MSFSAFELFGDPAPLAARVGANGWMSFDTGAVVSGAYRNQSIPQAAAPNGVIAPFWQDLDTVTLCRKDDALANTVTFQWTGRVYQQAMQPVQFQLVLSSSGLLRFIYGPGHGTTGAFNDSDGNGATVGVETPGGTFGHQVGFSQPVAAPNTSYTLTPN